MVSAQDTYLLDDDGTVEVVYRLDELPAVTRRLAISSSSEYAGLWKRAAAEPVMREILGHKKLFVQITQRNGERHRVSFLLDGYDVVAAEAAKTCGWSLVSQ